ncbi:2-oxoglutarate dehydrogenase E1 component [Rickettsiales bacterium Ac37b]|nr:2-oxoglutarate dehydrogenase E1 component [Rickettsiales bacterium Ac37b]
MYEEKNSYLYPANVSFIEELYAKYLEDKESVDKTWQDFFASFPNEQELKASWTKIDTKVILGPEKTPEIKGKAIPVESNNKLQVKALINDYRRLGHFAADLDPLKLEKTPSINDLGLEAINYGFAESDYDQNLPEEIEGLGLVTLRKLESFLQKVYCNHIGTEFLHIENKEEVEWIKNKIESLPFEKEFSADKKKSLLKDIIQVEGFEQFVHSRFPGAKRFSVEGGANSICVIDEIINKSTDFDVKEAILGMAHRGRLNVLTKIVGKPYKHMLAEFSGTKAYPEDLNVDGDVKYHLGASGDREVNNKKIYLSLTPNPSHLEAVNPVVAGKVRAKQDFCGDKERNKIMGILIHGDAAFTGQGVVAETLVLGELEGYCTGGTIHVVINNQIGFTTDPKKGRPNRYSTEFAKIIEAPIFHVNGDDIEALIRISHIAVEFRQKFKKDVVIDVTCYRLYGHNETDEPAFTQPIMYKNIGKHKTSAEVYAEKLIEQKIINVDEFKQIKEDFFKYLDQELEAAKSYKPKEADWLSGKWQGFERVSDEGFIDKENTGVDIDKLKSIGKALTNIPSGFSVNSKISRQLELKKKMLETGEGIDWSTAESLAFGTLLSEKIAVRLSGQDSGRGTFSHRHAVLVDQENNSNYIPLNNLNQEQSNFEVIDSNLSEYAVLGFEYGYSYVEPKSLVLWEAQFGDFANGAQIIIDQFIAAAETKWLRMSGLVMLLPHGYEGQGPEHSSARLERFLQLCAEYNLQIANCSTPASYFHILRRQIHRKYRKPLIIMSPKSLLRHKLAISNLKEFSGDSKFRPLIPEELLNPNDKDIRKVVFSSGKVYYDLLEERNKLGINDVALVRLEQYYPLPKVAIIEQLKKYKNAEFVWCQEEPRNMGAWGFLKDKFEELLQELKLSNKVLLYAGRKEAASPASGYKKTHDQEQETLIKEALN